MHPPGLLANGGTSPPEEQIFTSPNHLPLLAIQDGLGLGNPHPRPVHGRLHPVHGSIHDKTVL